MVLYMLSGQKYGGINTTTEAYVCEAHGPSDWYWPTYVPVYAIPGAHLSMRSGLLPSTQFRLRGMPVRSVESVTENSTVVDPAVYDVMNARILRRKGGTHWNFCGDGVTVEYTYGAQIPALGRSSARLLANEMLKATTDPDNCQLPDRVTSVSRQGISFTILDPQDYLEKGRTGIYTIDLFLSSVNPSKSKKPARVYSVDTPRAYRIT